MFNVKTFTESTNIDIYFIYKKDMNDFFFVWSIDNFIYGIKLFRYNFLHTVTILKISTNKIQSLVDL